MQEDSPFNIDLLQEGDRLSVLENVAQTHCQILVNHSMDRLMVYNDSHQAEERVQGFAPTPSLIPMS
ncbi:hypothetical protein [Leptothermofonsia sp. ETS-13]|uniref:hypothetical protein n=1 Tax=Leptothermofonsia sp. ETS-13 TaxID=3035696 RepID=UPI003B9E0FEB